MKCPCTPTADYANCCHQYHVGASAPNAEALMRSRFSAFYVGDVDCIIATTVPAQQSLLDKMALQAWADNTHWTHLEVISHNRVGKHHAQVHFRAFYLDDAGVEHCHDERSAFVKVGERWYFLDPTISTMLTGKQPCLCGSGEKYKRCCGRFLA